MTDEIENVIEIKILERPYKVKCSPKEAQELRASARYLEEQMKKVCQSSNITNTDRVAVVTALNICHELLRLKQEQKQSAQSVNQRILDLNKRVKNSLAEQEELAV